MAYPAELSNISKSNPSSYGQGVIHEIDVNHKECKRNAASEIQDVDIEMQSCCSEGLPDENDCMWLSSSNLPPSFRRSDTLELMDVLEIVMLCYQIYTMSLVLRIHGAFSDKGQRNFVSDGSCMNSIEASPILETIQNGNPIQPSPTLDSVQNGVGEGPKCCTNDEMNYSPMGFLMGVESDNGWFLHEAPSNLGSLSGRCDKPFPWYDHHLDRASTWMSVLDLEAEDAKWDGDAFDILGQDFPSPSYHTQKNLQAQCCNQTSKQVSDMETLLVSPNSLFNPSRKCVSDTEFLLKDSEADEPLFWPFDQKSYWSPELEGNYLGIPSCTTILNVKKPMGCHASKLVQFKLYQKKNTLRRKHMQQGYQGKLLFRSMLLQLIPADHKTRDSRSLAAYNTKISSAQSRSTRQSYDKADFNISRSKRIKSSHKSDYISNKHGVKQKTSLVQYLLEFEADDFKIYLEGGIPIETLVGLDEFDGHEGIAGMASGWSTEAFHELLLL